MYEQLLPIGSVVKLQGVSREVMIYGVLQKTPEGEKYDYVAVPFPEGYTTVMTVIAFNHKNIEEIIFRGYESDTYKDFSALLALSQMQEEDKSNQETPKE